jgi:hypothetical protein
MQRPSWHRDKVWLGCGNVAALLAAVALAGVTPPTVKVFDILLVRPGGSLPEAFGRMGPLAAVAALWAAGMAAAAAGFAGLARRRPLPLASRLLVVAAGVAAMVASGIVVVGHWRVLDFFHITTAEEFVSIESLSTLATSQAVVIQIGYGVLVLVPVLLAAASLVAGGAAPPSGERNGDLAPVVLALFIFLLGAAFTLLHLLSWQQAVAVEHLFASPQPIHTGELARLVGGIFNKGLLAGIVLFFQGAVWGLMALLPAWSPTA